MSREIPRHTGGGSRTDAGGGNTLLVLALVFLATLYAGAGIVMTNMRTQQLGPLCGRHGWVIIDTGMGQSAKCLDPTSGLMYLPPEVFNRR